MVSCLGYPSDPWPSTARGLKVSVITAIRGHPRDSYDEKEIFKDWISKLYWQVTSFVFRIDHERSWWHARIQVNGQFILWSKNTIPKVLFQPQVIFTHHSVGPWFFLVHTVYRSKDYLDISYSLVELALTSEFLVPPQCCALNFPEKRARFGFFFSGFTDKDGTVCSTVKLLLK